MFSTFNVPARWIDVAQTLARAPQGMTVRLHRSQVEHPRDAGMRPALAMPVGQRGQFRMSFEDGRDLVVTDFGTHYEGQLALRPALADFETVLRESPGSSVAGMVAAGALVGLVLGGDKNSAMAGAAIGGLAGLAGVGVANAEKSPEVTKAALQAIAAMRPSVTSIPLPGMVTGSTLPKRGQR